MVEGTSVENPITATAAVPTIMPTTKYVLEWPENLSTGLLWFDSTKGSGQAFRLGAEDERVLNGRQTSKHHFWSSIF